MFHVTPPASPLLLLSLLTFPVCIWDLCCYRNRVFFMRGTLVENPKCRVPQIPIIDLPTDPNPVPCTEISYILYRLLYSARANSSFSNPRWRLLLFRRVLCCMCPNVFCIDTFTPGVPRRRCVGMRPMSVDWKQ